MKKKLLFATGCLFLILSSSMVFAENQGLYMGGRFGTCFLNDSTLSEEGVPFTIDTAFDTGKVLEGVAGYDFGMFRVEGEIGYRNNDVDKFSAFGVSVEGSGDVDTLSFMINGYFDLETQSSLTPFIGVGIGYAETSVNDFSVGGIDIGSEKDDVFAYQFELGLGYSVTKIFIFDIAYKYFATENPVFFTGTEAEYHSHNITIGFRLLSN